MADAYQGSGGWTGGANAFGSNGVFGGTDGLLGSYMAKLRTVNPATGTLTTAQPTQPNQQMSSLARTVQAPQDTPAQYSAQPKQNLAQPAAQPSTDGLSPAAGRNLRMVGGAPVGAAMPTGQNITARQTQDVNGVRVELGWDANRGEWIELGVSDIPFSIWSPFQSAGNAAASSFAKANGITADTRNQAIAQATASRPDLLSAYASDSQNMFAKAMQQRAQENQMAQAEADRLQAEAAQLAADKAAAFNLSYLQAPNTTAVDAAGRADTARLISKYAASGYGPEGASLAAQGTRDAGDQAIVNKVKHDTAYADSFAQNYGVFSNALKSQREASVSASAQQLNLDMQGIGDAISQMAQQASQLSQESRTATEAALIPLRQALAEYKRAERLYGIASDQAIGAAQMVLSAGGSLAAGVVGGAA